MQSVAWFAESSVVSTGHYLAQRLSHLQLDGQCTTIVRTNRKRVHWEMIHVVQSIKKSHFFVHQLMSCPWIIYQISVSFDVSMRKIKKINEKKHKTNIKMEQKRKRALSLCWDFGERQRLNMCQWTATEWDSSPPHRLNSESQSVCCWSESRSTRVKGWEGGMRGRQQWRRGRKEGGSSALAGEWTATEGSGRRETQVLTRRKEGKPRP